jgi:hypothetical protein
MPTKASSRFSQASVLVAALVLATAACIDVADDTPAIDETVQEIGTVDPLGCADDASSAIKDVVTAMDKIGKIYSGVGVIVELAKWFIGEQSPEQRMMARFDRIDAKLQQLLDYEIAGQKSHAKARIGQYRTAITGASAVLNGWMMRRQAGEPETPAEFQDRITHVTALKGAIRGLLDQDVTARFHVPSLLGGAWHSRISHDPSREGLVWDYQLSLPLAVMGMQILMLYWAAEDPIFHRNGRYGEEIDHFADYFFAARHRMIQQVQCDPSGTQFMAHGGLWAAGVVCANTATGLHSTGFVTAPDPQALQQAVNQWNLEVREELLAKMGVGELTQLVFTLDEAADAVDPVIVTGHFDRDGRSDIALVGLGATERMAVPIAFSTGSGVFQVVPGELSNENRDFVRAAIEPGVKVAAADFDNDGLTDIALVGGPEWSTIRVAFARGDGSFRYTSAPVLGEFSGLYFNIWAQTAGVQVVAADVNGDRLDDLALAGGNGWSAVPVALSLGASGGFLVRNDSAGMFPVFAAQPGAKLLAGRFTGSQVVGDHLALAGGSNWNTVPIAWMWLRGDFGSTTPVDVLNEWQSSFAVHARGGTKLVGDFDGNGHDDIATVWSSPHTIPLVAYRRSTSPWFPWLSSQIQLDATGLEPFRQIGAVPVAGDFDGNGKPDIAALGGWGWTSIPVGLNDGLRLHVTNHGVGVFSLWAQQGIRPR